MIELLVIRHGIAEDQAAADVPDEQVPDFERRLTRKGRKRMLAAAAGLRSICPGLDLVVTSPLVRAVETAGIVADGYGEVAVTQLAALAPGAPWDDFLLWLKEQPDGGRIAAVGHEPHLSRWCSWMLSGGQRPMFGFKKGGTCLMKLSTPPAPGECELVWLMTPRQLRKLAG